MATAPCGASQNNLTLDEIIYPIFDDFSHFWCFYSKWNIKYEERERMLSMIYEFLIANHFSFRQFLLHIFCVLAAFLPPPYSKWILLNWNLYHGFAPTERGKEKPALYENSPANYIYRFRFAWFMRTNFAYKTKLIAATESADISPRSPLHFQLIRNVFDFNAICVNGIWHCFWALRW